MSNETGVDLPAQITKPRTTSFIRESFTSNFWMSGLEILKYIPRSFRVKQVDGNAFFAEEKRDEFRGRILRVTPTNPRRWGTMTVAQMLHHLNLSSGGSLGFYDLPDESYFVSRTVFRWILVDWFPEQLVGLRLPKGSRFLTTRNSTLTSKNNNSSKSWMLPGVQDRLPIGVRTPCSEE